MGVGKDTRRGEVAVRGLFKSFVLVGRRPTVLRGLDLDIPAGDCLAIVGASGLGKTMLLRLLAGLETPDVGEVRIDGGPVQGVGAERAVIFREPRLLPRLTVLGNVAFGLEAPGGAPPRDRGPRPPDDQAGRADGLRGGLPRQLSGGVAQRTGIARALAIRPEILLLDEPLGALDAMTLQEKLARIWRDGRVTMVPVTHDLEEAILLGRSDAGPPLARDGAPTPPRRGPGSPARPERARLRGPASATHGRAQPHRDRQAS